MKQQSGVVTVEFALGFGLFWMMVVAWMEMSMMSYVSAISDLAISEASREAKKETSSYISAFYQVLNESDSIWKNLVDEENFSASVRYINTFDDLLAVADTCAVAEGSQTNTCGTESNAAIAIYSISYNYQSVFTYFLDTESVFSREVIVVQEYERDQFQI
ncbi:TadE/TadG family type IV pilus assembly protein [Vibrio tapetis]|uniref:Membrane associated secretion system protein n=1 Tax=Vibrio tapetis subsp. tapetis TaxID=1671868 RepID=A0A2N8ZC69_9VIBR|nr:TadE family protein [Vibrio tapetis]SON49505.1 Membrane associated secretion system protein [Vibrio tapetis subsp. tapetis]